MEEMSDNLSTEELLNECSTLYFQRSNLKNSQPFIKDDSAFLVFLEIKKFYFLNILFKKIIFFFKFNHVNYIQLTYFNLCGELSNCGVPNCTKHMLGLVGKQKPM